MVFLLRFSSFLLSLSFSLHKLKEFFLILLQFPISAFIGLINLWSFKKGPFKAGPSSFWLIGMTTKSESLRILIGEQPELFGFEDLFTYFSRVLLEIKKFEIFLDK